MGECPRARRCRVPHTLGVLEEAVGALLARA